MSAALPQTIGVTVLPATPHILTRAEAMAYVKVRSQGAFCAWCHRWRVRPQSRGRYSKVVLDLALSREAGIRHTPASFKRAAA